MAGHRYMKGEALDVTAVHLYLGALIESLDYEADIDEFWLKKVHGNTASRAYFIRGLTSAYLFCTGKPHRRHLAAIVSQLFGDIDERTVIRLSQGISGKEWKRQTYRVDLSYEVAERGGSF